MERTDKSTLIAVEGIDGAGKTTQLARLVEFFQACGEPVVQSKEPTDGPWGVKIRKSASNGRMSLAEELQAFAEDRKEHISKTIQPALTQGKTVILDRYFYSTIAYQGSHSDNPDDIAAQMFDLALIPDVVILIDVPAEVGVSRIKNGRDEKPNAFEKMKTLRAARDVFLGLAKKHKNIFLVDGTRDVEGVRRAILEHLIYGVLKKRFCAKEYGCDQPELCSYRAAGTCRWARMCRNSNLYPTPASCTS
jgi:dTMP kinase